MRAEVYVDPACGWCQVAVRWLQAVVALRPVEVHLLPYSLLLRDGADRPPEQVARPTASLPALRVMERLVAEAPALRLAYWDAVVAQDGWTPFADLAAAARTAGVRDAQGAADDERVDDALRRRMSFADSLIGGPAVLPLIALDGRVGFTGPLLRAAPAADDAASLWDAVLALARTEGFYELSRPRPPHPAIPELPPVPVPPRLQQE